MSPGRKDDAGKDAWRLLPSKALRAVVRVLMHGAFTKGYGEGNWEKVPNHRERYFDAAQRHLWAWWEGERVDPESGELHLAHAACCVLFLVAKELQQ